MVERFLLLSLEGDLQVGARTVSFFGALNFSSLSLPFKSFQLSHLAMHSQARIKVSHHFSITIKNDYRFS